ncbi:MAG: glycosyltransferase [Candidatus Methanoperedens sp.]|nr:glycosyltransferase [Candidatus Methanoperedens sp.]MCZ7405738.1 glycosyltransferase [Candidatus Methanoperedens sp.]
MISASIILLTKNGGEDINKCLFAIFSQKTSHSFEVIAIDSGSTDATPDILSKFPIKVLRIKPEEFGHGTTRNLGARLAKGKYLVYITQDAIPYNEYWLDFLINSVNKDQEVAGAYSRNIPKPGCDPFEARYIAKAWGENREVKIIKNCKNYKRLVFFSDTSSCIRKDIWEKFPFNEELVQTEDQDWSKRVLESGYKIVYEPASIVFHSHSYSIKKLFSKYFDAGTAHKQIFKDNNNVYLPLIPFFAIAVMLLDLKFMVNRNYRLLSILKWIPNSIIRHLTEAIGFWLGLHSRFLPAKIKRNFTMYGRY